MNRRGFLEGLTAFAAHCTLDPEFERVLGAKTISIPAPSLSPCLIGDEVLRVRYFRPAAQAFHDALLKGHQDMQFVMVSPDAR